MNIHPSAVIHPAARLADDVIIGPGVCIEGPAKIGHGCELKANAILSGSVEMGEHNTIGYGAVIGAPPQDLAFDPATASGVIIGERNVIRELCTIHRGTATGTQTSIGSDNFLMVGCHVGHNAQVGNHCILANNVLLGGHAQVQDRVFIGGGCVFHQFTRIGAYALAQGLSAFSKDIPPYTIGAERNGVAGLNVIGLRRNAFNAAQREEIKQVFGLFYGGGKNVSQALEAADSMNLSEAGLRFVSFVREAKKRGLCGFLRTPASAAPASASTAGVALQG